LPYKSLSSQLIASEKEFVHLGEMAKWMESSCWCQVCFDPLGPKGAFQIGAVWPCIPCRMHLTECATLYGVSIVPSIVATKILQIVWHSG
jgi:hypothetical protein